MPVPKIDVWGIFPTQFLSQNTNFKSELKNVNKHGILKFTLLLIKLEVDCRCRINVFEIILKILLVGDSNSEVQVPTVGFYRPIKVTIFF